MDGKEKEDKTVGVGNEKRQKKRVEWEMEFLIKKGGKIYFNGKWNF